MEFTVPAGYTAIPIGITPEEAERDITSRISVEVLKSKPAMFRHMVGKLHQASQALERTGALYAGTCMRAHEGELSLGTLLVTVHPFSYGDAEVAAKGMVHALITARGNSWSGTVLETSSGPVAVVSGTREVAVPAKESPSGEEAMIPMAEMQAFMPVPPGIETQEQCLVSIDFSTPCEEHWDDYCADIVELLHSVSFDQDDGPASPEVAAHTNAPTSPKAVPGPAAGPTGSGIPTTPFG
ncbi:hypothetical protein [Streptomyces natalensis]|uniref:hypothetical protein n=1 Tax=Streptomyces natalensis TaxID=68242 RepID=UPI000ABE0C4E|nr:hypothetical protein [Streptomyces natalensis]